MNNNPTQNPLKRVVAKLLASAALTVFAVAMPMAAHAGKPTVSVVVESDEAEVDGGMFTMSVSWGGCSACAK